MEEIKVGDVVFIINRFRDENTALIEKPEIISRIEYGNHYLKGHASPEKRKYIMTMSEAIAELEKQKLSINDRIEQLEYWREYGRTETK